MQITIKTIKNTQQTLQKQLFVDIQQITNIQTIQAYKEALSFSNLLIQNQIHIRNVKIFQNDHIHEIYVNSNLRKRQNKKELPHLVMLHGFGGVALTFVRTFQHLKQHYQIHALDTFGIGLSSLGNYSQKFTHQQTKSYYIDAIEQWRKTLKINSFTLLGHSFGGYISALYCQKYPGHVNRLILLSPAGTSLRSRKEIQQQVQKRRSISFGSKVFMCLGQKIYNINIKPSSLINSCIVGNKFIKIVTEDRLKLKDKQRQAWAKYIKQVCKKRQTSQTGFYKLFEWPLTAKRSIEQIINDRPDDFNFPIQFYFGDSDWMQRSGAIRLQKSRKNVIFEIVRDAGHQIIFDNHMAVVQKILRQVRIDDLEIQIKVNEQQDL